MKKQKFLIGAVAVVLLSLIACNKEFQHDTDLQTLDSVVVSDGEYDFDYAENIPPELEERAASLTGAALKNGNALAASDPCHNPKFEGYQIIPNGASSVWTLTGSELGSAQTLNALKGSASVTGYVKAIVYQSSPALNKDKSDTLTCTVGTWSPTSIEATLPSVNFDSLRTFAIKFIVGYPVQAKDSSVVSIKEKKKAIKCMGSFLGARYGTFQWSVNMLAKYGNSVKLPTGMSVVTGNSSLTAAPTYGAAANLATDSTNLTPLQVGDILERADGTKGVVYGVSARDPKKGYKVRVQQVVCDKAAIKSGTWTFTFPTGMKAKSDESGGSWTKFSRKQ